jgi:hypothetical protein
VESTVVFKNQGTKLQTAELHCKLTMHLARKCGNLLTHYSNYQSWNFHHLSSVTIDNWHASPGRPEKVEIGRFRHAAQVSCSLSPVYLPTPWRLGATILRVSISKLSHLDDCLSQLTGAGYRISAYPDLTFVVILNPHNGPGASEFPDAKYAMEIPRLNAWPNVITVGYVRIDYCKRDLVEVFRDVTKYSGWADGVQGIFLDETPNVYTASMATYLDGVDRFVKETVRIRGSRLVSNFNS